MLQQKANKEKVGFGQSLGNNSQLLASILNPWYKSSTTFSTEPSARAQDLIVSVNHLLDTHHVSQKEVERIEEALVNQRNEIDPKRSPTYDISGMGLQEIKPQSFGQTSKEMSQYRKNLRIGLRSNAFPEPSDPEKKWYIRWTCLSSMQQHWITDELEKRPGQDGGNKTQYMSLLHDDSDFMVLLHHPKMDFILNAPGI